MSSKEAVMNALWVRLFFTDRMVIDRYARIGAEFVEAYPSRRRAARRMFPAWAFWEREYARRGYRPLPPDHFRNYWHQDGHSADRIPGIHDRRGKNESARPFATPGDWFPST